MTDTTPVKKVVTLRQYSARRAICAIGNNVYVYRLRRPSAKTNEQKVRDLVKTLKFDAPEKAQTAMELIIAQAQDKRFDASENDDTEYKLGK